MQHDKYYKSKENAKTLYQPRPAKVLNHDPVNELKNTNSWHQISPLVPQVRKNLNGIHHRSISHGGEGIFNHHSIINLIST